MDINRVKQILTSNQQIDVVFEGESIWIDDLDEVKNTVLCHTINTGKNMEVNADRLHEPQ